MQQLKRCRNCGKDMRGLLCLSVRLHCCNACYLTWRQRPEQIAARFWVKVKKAAGNACWIWQGARSSVSGYGTFNYHGHNINAHRAAWLIVNGPIKGKDIDALHTCNNGHIGCIRPSHLYLGTHWDNMQDKIAAGMSLRGEDSPRAKLTEAQVKVIRAEYQFSRTGKRRRRYSNAKELAARYGVCTGIIAGIASRRLWKHVQ